MVIVIVNNSCCFDVWTFTGLSPEEREKPELLAESPARRKRVAQDSGKTEQQVRGTDLF